MPIFIGGYFFSAMRTYCFGFMKIHGMSNKSVPNLRRKLAKEKVLSLLKEAKEDLNKSQAIIQNINTDGPKNIISKNECDHTPKVLLIDDDKHVLDIARLALEHEGVEIVTSSNPDCADLIIKENPDLILVDVDMPCFKGPEVAAAMLQEPRLVKGKILLYSGLSEHEMKRLTEVCGADGYIIKKGSPKQFVEEIKTWLAML